MLWADAAHPLGPGISISSLSVSQTTCAVGSDDGYVRLWPLDFSSVLLEAGGAMTPTATARAAAGGPCSGAVPWLEGSRGLQRAEC